MAYLSRPDGGECRVNAADNCLSARTDNPLQSSRASDLGTGKVIAKTRVQRRSRAYYAFMQPKFVNATYYVPISSIINEKAARQVSNGPCELKCAQAIENRETSADQNKIDEYASTQVKSGDLAPPALPVTLYAVENGEIYVMDSYNVYLTALSSVSSPHALKLSWAQPKFSYTDSDSCVVTEMPAGRYNLSTRYYVSPTYEPRVYKGRSRAADGFESSLLAYNSYFRALRRYRYQSNPKVPPNQILCNDKTADSQTAVEILGFVNISDIQYMYTLVETLREENARLRECDPAYLQRDIEQKQQIIYNMLECGGNYGLRREVVEVVGEMYYLKRRIAGE